MLETIREYAVDQLSGSGELEVVQTAHAGWVRTMAEQSERDWVTPEGTAWFLRLNREIDNVRVAIDWGLRHDRELSLAVAADLWLFWPHSDRATEGRRILEEAWDEDAPVELRKRALRALTAVAGDANDHAAVAEASWKRLELARATGDIRHEAAALNMLGAAAGLEGDRQRGRQFYEESVELHRRMDDPAALAGAIGNLGLLERQDGELSTAQELLDESLALSRAHGSELDVVWALKEVAMTAIAGGSYSEARECISEGFERAAMFELSIMEVDLMFAVAILASKTQRTADAALLLGAVSGLWEASGTEILPSFADWSVTVERVRAALGESVFDTQFEQGRSMERASAIRHAVDCLD